MTKLILSYEIIANKIILIRGKRVMLDRDLANMYGVKTKVLNQAVKRNIGRFPDDFMFRLNKKEFEDWRSQFVTSKSDKKGLRRAPYAFTDYGILMLSSVLNSERAIQVNIAIMRVFVKLREMLSAHEQLTDKLTELERKIGRHDKDILMIFEAIKQLMRPKEEARKVIKGFGN